jgi:hypothetical protein
MHKKTDPADIKEVSIIRGVLAADKSGSATSLLGNVTLSQQQVHCFGKTVYENDNPQARCW